MQTARSPNRPCSILLKRQLLQLTSQFRTFHHAYTSVAAASALKRTTSESLSKRASLFTEKRVLSSKDMKWIEGLIIYFFPQILLEGKPWRAMWEEKEADTFVRICRVFFLVAGLLYIAHFYFYDLPMGLEPIGKWFTFRVVAAGASFAALAFYLSPLAKARFHKVPAMLVCWLFCYTQAMVVTWWDGTPWLFGFVFVTACMMVIRASPLPTILLSTLIMLTQTPFFLQSGVPLSSVISTAFTTLVIILVLRASHATEIRNFALNQENIAAQKRIIELNIEFADRIRAFIPRVIAQRLETLMKDDRLTVIQAAVEVLRPRKTEVACIFSDIRGYTKGSKDLDQFIDKSVMPEMKACSNTVERFHGIPRKIGDLIFGYFDDASNSKNVVRCVMTGIEISHLNQDLNATSASSEIRRYILIATGEAIVGNLGGLDSSIEITALGPPVNFLSRLDDATKQKALANKIQPGDILLCPRTRDVLRGLDPTLDLECLDLDELKIPIRDFGEIRAIYRLKRGNDNYARIRALYESAEDNTISTDGVSSLDEYRLTG